MIGEMCKLRDYLNAKGIEWEDSSDTMICRTKFAKGNRIVSVINGFGTYGGYNRLSKNYGLLEMRIGHDEPIGYLTADEVIERVISI